MICPLRTRKGFSKDPTAGSPAILGCRTGCAKGPTEGPTPRVRDLLGEVGDAVLRAPVHPTVLVPPAEVTVPSTVVPGGRQRRQGL